MWPSLLKCNLGEVCILLNECWAGPPGTAHCGFNAVSNKNSFTGLKARSHCSDNENDNDKDAKRTHSYG